MTASELITELQKLIAKHGDVEVMIPQTEDHWGDVGYRDINSVEFVSPTPRDRHATVPHQHNEDPLIYIS
jgi:hypothetical protein